MESLLNQAPRWGVCLVFTPIAKMAYDLFMKIRRTYQFRFYPNQEQRIQLAQTFGSCRFVYNWALRLRTDAYLVCLTQVGESTRIQEF